MPAACANAVAASPAPAPLLQPGDVLISGGRWQLSQWIAWNAGCSYSHAVLAVAPDAVLEARMPLAQVRSVRAVLEEPPERVDVFLQLDRDGSERSQAHRTRVVGAGPGLRGVPSAMPRLPGLAWRTLLNHALSPAPIARAGMDAWRSDLTCCELGYVVLHQCVGQDCSQRRRVRRPRPTLQLRRLLRKLCGARPGDGDGDGREETFLQAPVRPVPVEIITTDLVSSPMLRHVSALAPIHSAPPAPG